MTAVLAALVLTLLTAGPAAAVDQPVAGARLFLSGSPTGKQKLVFLSKDPALLVPTRATADDPATGSPGGALIELFSPVEVPANLTVPAGQGVPGWVSSPGAKTAYRFKNPGAPDAASPVQSITLKQERVLKIVARRSGLALAGPEGAVGIRVTMGSLRNCALFGGASVRRDEAGFFDARSAAAPAVPDCSDGSLGGPVCGNGRVEPGEQCGEPGLGCADPCTTCVQCICAAKPVVCGDGLICGDEVCDGTALGPCASFPSGGGFCGSPGFSNACRCCSNGGPYTALIGCCDPSAILVPQGPPEGGLCIPSRCDAPFTCTGCSPPYVCEGNQCQPDGSCCTGLGGTCRWTLGLGSPGERLNPCCPGLACLGEGSWGPTCCLGGGGACTSAADCCSRSCGPSGTCDGCRFAGSACGSPSDCCSLSCTGGLCDACGVAGTPCVPGSVCCSGVCNATTGQCD